MRATIPAVHDSVQHGRAGFLQESVAVAILAAAAVWAPLAFGASGTWARLGVELSMTAAVVLWATAGPRAIWLTIVPLCVALLLVLQLVSLPDSWLVWLAPVSAGAWKVAITGIPNAAARVTIDPAATWAGIRAVFLATATASVVTGLARQQSHRRILLAGIGISGVLILITAAFSDRIREYGIMLGILDLTSPISPGQGPLLAHAQSNGVGVGTWVDLGANRYLSESGWIGGCFGTFLYANHLAAAVCVTLPIVVSWWLWLTAGRLPAWVRWPVVVAFATAGAWVAAVLTSSRAGTGALALTIATLITLIAPLRWLRYGFGVAAATVALGAASFFICILLPQQAVLTIVPADFQQQAIKLLADGRGASAHVAMRAFAASPLLGTGLDTFQDVFPKFYKDRYTLFYAHNEYAQLLAETGLLGAAMMIAAVAFLSPRAIRFWRDAPGQYRVLNAGPWAALAGITVHSGFDWNFHLPSIALLALIVFGLCASSVPARKPDDQHKPRIPEYVPRWLLVGCCVILVGWLCRDAVSESGQRQLREAILADRLAQKDPKRPSAIEALNRAIAAGEAAASWDPGDADLLALLGQAYHHAARSIGSERERNVLLGKADRWCLRARTAAAMCRGLPEPVIPVSQAPTSPAKN